ncbi:MAG TPA: hypothetical protein VGR53_09170 [Nitrososphaerales archaeon]|nr:hypothetical protein [Nitrososphaerales archaeon]
MKQEENLRAVVQSSVEQSIRDVLGAEAMKTLIFHVPPELLITSPLEYRERLVAIVKNGAPTLEYLILKDLSEHLGIRLGKDSSDVVMFMKRVRDMILSGQALRPGGKPKDE